MNVDLMRKIDLYVGIPICFILTLWYKFLNLLGIAKLPAGFKPKRILFIELSEMGSTVLAYSAMKKAKALGCEIYFLIFKENDKSIKLLDIVPNNNIITIKSKSFLALIFDTFSALRKIKKAKIDTVIDLELFSRFTSILSFCSGAKARVGFYKYHMEGLYRGNFLTHKVSYNPHYHVSQLFHALVDSLSMDPNELPMVKKEIKLSDITCPKINVSEKQKDEIIKKIQAENNSITKNSKIVLLNPNASQLLPIRKWPLDNFKALADKILKNTNAFLVITGTLEEKDDARAISEYVDNPKCIDFTGKTTFEELLPLYSVSRVMVTNDSGPAHFGSLTDIHIIVLFGPETPIIYGPLSKNGQALYSNFACSPCVSAFNHRKTSCTNARCLKAINVEKVYNIVKSKL